MTNQVKHTPGPWVTTAIKRKGKLIYWAINGTDAVGANLTSGRIVDVPSAVPNHDGPTQEANARLIAAAPELLEALRGVVELAARETLIAGTHRRTEAQTMIVKARAALAKAMGGQS